MKSRPDQIGVLILTTSFPLGVVSSSGVFVKYLAEYLSRHLQIKVLTPCPDYRFENNTQYPVHCFCYAPRHMQLLAHAPGGLPASIKKPGNWILLPSFFLAMFVSCIYYARGADIIHANWSINGLIAGVAGLIARRSVVMTLRGSDIERAERSIVDCLILRSSVFLSHSVVTVSHSLSDRVQKLLPSFNKEITVIPNGVRDDLLKIKLNKDNLQLNFIVVANLIPIKGVDLVVKAFAKSGLRGRANLLVVGDGPERESLEALIKSLGLTECVSLVGSVSPGRMVDIYSKADVLVHASYAEGRANVIIEAMAAGVFVIGSDIDGTAEVIRHGNNGMLFKSGDIETLSSTMNIVETDSELRMRIAKQARQFVVTQGLTWEHTAQEYMSVYKRIIQKEL